MLERAKRASHIDPPASSYAIMRRARPYRGENPEYPARMFVESLTPGPELENGLGPTLGGALLYEPTDIWASTFPSFIRYRARRIPP